MELDDLKVVWAQQTSRLESSLRLNDLFMRQATARQAQSSLQSLCRAVSIELFLVFAVIVALGSFAAEHIAQPAIAFCATLLWVYGLAIAQGEIRQLIALRAIDFDEAVVTIQRKLERGRVLRLRTTGWALLFGPLLWLPLCAVLLRAFVGTDLFAVLPWPYVATNVLLGFAVIPITIWIAKRYAVNLRASRFFGALAREISGTHLRAAFEYLDTLDRFEAA